MTISEFIQKYDGKFVDFDGRFGPQCMDLYRQYVKEVLMLPQSNPVPSAADVWDHYLKDYYFRIENQPTNVPSVGDIMIWNKNAGPHGHIAIFIEGDTNRFKSFDQNFPIGSPCHAQGHKYNNVIGWMHPIASSATSSPQPQLPVYLTTLLQENKLDLSNEGQIREFFQKAIEFDGVKKDLDNSKMKIKSLETELDVLDQVITKSEEERTECKIKLSDALKTVPIPNLANIPAKVLFKELIARILG